MRKFHIVLFEPEIPQNAGGIGRLCVSNDVSLHLVEPLGFSLDDKYVRRAGMDYWRHVALTVHRSWEDFLIWRGERPMYFFSTKTTRSYWSCPYEDESCLIFGRESSGLPEDFYRRYEPLLYTIPMRGNFHRSLNLANSTAIVLYEALRHDAQMP
ncbi:MAG: tRNA (cytidine(34)-2'-O)-methyltransferase [Victivallaceae bacterium]|nr:tRNA (cytidine(34)-2'-O)-methyltransferase [Victivallaceae bacterium]